MKKVLLGVSAIAILVTGAVVSVSGGARADDPINDIKYRQTNMDALGAHMGALAAIAKGQVSYTSHMAAHADAIAAIGKFLPDLFPEGSDMGKTRALPAIWEQPDKFAKAVKAFQTQSAKLAEVAASGDRAALGAQLGEVGKTCGGCHKPFREKKK